MTTQVPLRTPSSEATGDSSARYVDAANHHVSASNQIDYAYRDVGEGDIPLMLLQHFRGNLDNWDPALIDDLAARRRVVTFDNVGVAATTGSTPHTIEAMAHDAIAFVDALNLDRIDLLGFSIALKIYPDSAHGFLFQHHTEFAADVHAFLDEVY